MSSTERRWARCMFARGKVRVCVMPARGQGLEKNAVPTAGTSYSTHPAPSNPSSAWATSGVCLIFLCGNSSQMSRHRHTSCTLFLEHQLWTNLTALPGLEETFHFPSNPLDPLYHFHNSDLEQWLHLWLHCFHFNLYSRWTISLRWLGSTGGGRGAGLSRLGISVWSVIRGKRKHAHGGGRAALFLSNTTSCI